MIPTECRDCGYKFETNSRGCPRCALNLEAEAMIDRFMLRIVPAILVSITLALALFFVYFR